MLYSTLLTLCSLTFSLAQSQPYPWTPPEYPPTTIENDGTKYNRYDVRKTLSYSTNNTNNVNNIFMLVWVTTTTGNKYHLTTNSGMIGSDRLGAFLSLNNLQDRTGRGSSLLQSGSAANILDWRAANQSIRAPAGGDGWTGTAFSMELSGVRLDLNIYPTGGNFYYGGNGGIQLFSRVSEFSARVVNNRTNVTGEVVDYSSAIPGWSWYWSNPTTRINGTISIDGRVEEIDTKHSYALFERQWGDFFVGRGYYILWLYLETGEVIITWAMEPDFTTGASEIAFASIWHPNGIHENVPVGPNSIASDVSVTRSGRRYFNHFVLDLPARNASFVFDKWIREGEIEPVLAEQRDSFSTISESYGEGVGVWNGRSVRAQGHVEQLTRLDGCLGC